MVTSVLFLTYHTPKRSTAWAGVGSISPAKTASPIMEWMFMAFLLTMPMRAIAVPALSRARPKEIARFGQYSFRLLDFGGPMPRRDRMRAHIRSDMSNAVRIVFPELLCSQHFDRVEP